MNDPSSKSVPESAPRAGKTHDTVGGGVTPPQPIGPDDPLTVPSNYPDAPHPAVADWPVGIGDYVIIRKIGEGGMGTVYLAEDTRLNRKAAIKTLQRELATNQVYRDRFEREARAAAAVEHDHIVPIWQVGEAADGTPFIAMPFLQGESLDARLARVPVADVGLVLKVAREVALGLAAAHAKGLVHRDIKPANIWLEGDLTAAEPAEQIRRCKILDFGLVRSVGTESVQITTPGQSPGTPAFMSPEQARGEQVDHRSDLWSLGVTLYRMATGVLPFNGPHAMAVLIALTTDSPPPVRDLAPGLPPALADLIDRLMSAPTTRPQSAAEVATTARQIAKELQTRKVVVPPVVVHSLPEVSPVAKSISESVPHLLPLSEELTEPDDTPEPAASGEAKRTNLPWVIAATVGLLALAPLGLVLSGAFSGKKAEGDVGVKSDDPKVTPPKVEPKNLDPDHTAALYVRSLGGCVWVNDKDEVIKADGKLPAGPFRLNGFQFLPDTRVTDAGLAAFAGCRNMVTLGLSDFPVGDAGLSHFRGCKELQYVYLGNTRVTSAGLATLADSTGLMELDLSSTPVDDTALPLLKRFTKLNILHLNDTKVTAKGVADLKKALPECDIKWDGKPEGP